MAQEDLDPRDPERRGFPTAFLVGLIIVGLLVAGLIIFSHSTQPARHAVIQKLPFGPTEQAYAPNIHPGNISMSQADNMLNQVFTYLDGTISNDGPRTLKALELTVEFHDPFNQVILRETHRVVESSGPPLAAGQHRDFEITFEHIPVEWNQQYPSVRVTGLVLE